MGTLFTIRLYATNKTSAETAAVTEAGVQGSCLWNIRGRVGVVGNNVVLVAASGETEREQDERDDGASHRALTVNVVVRALVNGGPTAIYVEHSLAWCIGILVVFAPIAVRLYRRAV